MSKTSDRLADKIFALCRDEDADIPEVTQVFEQVVMYLWSFLCEECRRNSAHRLSANIAMMLDYANSEAARRGGSEGHTCH
jgi:hypothetical protein